MFSLYDLQPLLKGGILGGEGGDLLTQPLKLDAGLLLLQFQPRIHVL